MNFKLEKKHKNGLAGILIEVSYVAACIGMGLLLSLILKIFR